MTLQSSCEELEWKEALCWLPNILWATIAVCKQDNVISPSTASQTSLPVSVFMCEPSPAHMLSGCVCVWHALYKTTPAPSHLPQWADRRWLCDALWLTPGAKHFCRCCALLPEWETSEVSQAKPQLGALILSAATPPMLQNTSIWTRMFRC